ncbi:MAG: hypothetical protein MMC33_006098 [Icmadophila ericetorum]|nr:hypothetical protein [Icmadophila ericetorum]
MAQVRTKPTPQNPSSIESISTSLDEALTRYLNLLHTYQSLRTDLNKHLSSVCSLPYSQTTQGLPRALQGFQKLMKTQGFISLAQANFSSASNRGGGRRYGEGDFDGRMRAGVGVNLNATAEGLKDKPAFESMDLKPELDLKSFTEKSKSSKFKSKKIPTDPLSWFGILVPQALRAAQTEFKAAVLGQVTQLASVVREMEGVEIEVRRLRKRIGKAGDGWVDSL